MQDFISPKNPKLSRTSRKSNTVHILYQRKNIIQAREKTCLYYKTKLRACNYRQKDEEYSIKNIKTLAASIASFTTVATMGIGCISASANGLTKVDIDLLADTATVEEKFVASYEKSDEKLAASYYIENGISLVEAQTMMDIY